ncbi:DUF5696 domain-containing protein [Paenibacillus thermotolerans]|uniref:DUF5696 domain-containing protein n=1 Tax=Paenibacillus thermotolerans TaxID=3027807 RepID=UPI00236878CE|nr:MULTISPECIES: DUF5696 domain-containing protein [unclassified Paenibacillus]
MSAINFLIRKRLSRFVKWIVFLLFAIWIVWWIVPDSGNQIEFTADPSSFISAERPEGAELPMEEGLRTYASDGRYELQADVKNQVIAIKDAATGRTWSSVPDTEGLEVRPLIARNIRSPFEVVYTADYTKTQLIGVNNKDTSWKAYKINNGIQFQYELKELKLGFIVDFVLEDGGFTVRIPDEGIRESGDRSAIVSIRVLPMFGAARPGDEGYMVVPDGSGALIYFNRLHNQAAYTEYSKWIYGTDTTFDTMSGGRPQDETIAAAAFGVVKDGGGFVETIEKGAADAKVTVNPPGIRNIPFFRGGFEFVLRKQFETSYGESLESNVIQQIERGRIRSDRVVRFDFAEEAATTYADLAALAGNRLLERPYGAGGSAPPLVQIFLGAESRGDSYSKRMETMTTFAEAQAMMEELMESGIGSFSAELKGWYNGGYFGSLPRRFPVEEAFGGESGLKKLLQWTDDHGIAVSLEDNYSDVYRKERDGIKLRTDTVRRPDGRQFVYYPYSAAGWYYRNSAWHKVSPVVADRDYVRQSFEKLSSLGVASINLRYAGEALLSDYNGSHPLRRWETQNVYERWIDTAKEKLGSAGVYYGNDYAVRHADRVLDIPLRSSPNYLLDEHVPFLQMMYHGKVPYYSSALNRSDDARLELLKAIEYGAVPAFELTYRTTTALRYTNYDLLFSSQYDTWLPAVKEAYEAWNEALKPVASRRITGHERLAAGVFRTTYEDGTHVWVNYNDHAVTQQRIHLEPLGYAVSKGGDGG